MLYIGNFLVLTDQEKVAENDRRHGEFSLIIEAVDTPAALRAFKGCILENRQEKDFFPGDCQIFLIQLLEFDRLPVNRAMMLTYKSTVGDPVLPYIGCLVPGEDTDSCRIFDWQDKHLEIDGRDEQLFMAFKADEKIAY